LAEGIRRRRTQSPPLPDVQMEEATVCVHAGVTNLQAVFDGPRWTLPIKYTILTPTYNHRGVHMSRLVAAAQKHSSAGYLEDSLRRICQEVDRTQPGSRVSAQLEYPYKDQFVHIKIETAQNSLLHYSFERIGITACPCSRKIIGIGHMQRASLKLQVTSPAILDFEEVALKMGECFSTVPEELLKRPDEARKITDAQLNPKFAEDLVRECLRRFPNASRIEARCFESIHIHDAIAIWSRTEDFAMPA